MGERAKPGSVQWAIDGFLYDCRARQLKPDSLASYQRKLNNLSAYLATVDVDGVTGITRELLRDYQQYLAEKGRDNNGIISELRIIRMWLKWMDDEELIDRAPRLKMPKAPEVVVPAYSLDDVEDLISAAGRTSFPERDTAILLVLFDTGLRASELCGIKTDDIEQDRLFVAHGKGSRQAWLQLSPRTMKGIWRWQKVRQQHPVLAESEWLFCSRRGIRLSRNDVYRLFRKVGQVAGIKGRVYAHKARHTVGIELLRSGVDSFLVQQQLRHKSFRMTQRYLSSIQSEDVGKATSSHSLVERLNKGKRR